MMHAIGYAKSLPITDDKALEAIEGPVPEPGPRDLLVEVHAVSVNPVDVKLRVLRPPESGHAVLGYDASGIVKAVGPDVAFFQPGDAVFYAGAFDRPGTNSALHVVDERIVGRKPASLTHKDAAALPLTSITAWEMLFDRFGIAEGSGEGETLLIVGGAGGVGSIMIQLARRLTGLTIVATASRSETVAWCRSMGAHHVINHHEPMGPQLDALSLQPTYVVGTSGTDHHYPALIDLLRPQGKFGLIDDPDPAKIDISLMKMKAVSLHWEFMFTRSLFQTRDMEAQHRLLNRVSALVEAGAIKTTATTDLGPLTVESLREAHRLQESGKAVGKTVLGALEPG